MSSRALRKLQREQELQKQLAAEKALEQEQQSQEDEEEEDVEEDIHAVAVKAPPKNAFDMLEDVEDEEDDDESDTAVPVSIPTKPVSVSHAQSTPKPSKSKKKKKKTKKKQQNGSSIPTPAQEESGDEIDRALKELAINNSTAEGNATPSEPIRTWEAHATHLLGIEPRNLNPTNEMKSLFGTIALEADSRASPRNQTQRRREVNQRGGIDLATSLTGRHTRASKGKQLGHLAHRRNIFMQGKEDWPLAATGGLSMEPITDHQSFEKRFNIKHSKLYDISQGEFIDAVKSNDADQLILLLSFQPYHIATLLQVSEIAKHQGDHSLCADLLERALFNFGRAAASAFGPALKDGTARIPFNRLANRELYLNIWRYIRTLETRGTYATAFEWAKLLFQLNTTSDPFAITLMIDQLALRGRSHDQLLSLTADDAYGPAWKHLPNIQISRVLALLRSKQTREARRQLAYCIHQYPYIISALASALDISPFPKALWAKLPSTDPEKLYTELYVIRAKDLWNTPETIPLVVEVADTLNYYPTPDSPPPKLEISLEEARHIKLLEIPSLLGYLPKSFHEMATSASDVLPPPRTEDTDFTARAPDAGTDASGPSALQAIVATANNTGQGIMAALNMVRNWFTAPAGDDEAAARAQEAIANLERRGIDQGTIEEYVQAGFFQDSDDEDGESGEGVERAVSRDDMGMRRTPGGWDSEPSSSSGGTPVPEREDAGASTLPPRNPRAAMVEDDDEDAVINQTLETTAGQPILVPADAADTTPTAARNTQPSSTTTPSTTNTSSTPTPASITPPPSILTDPQRLQRHLLTTGFTALLNSANSSTSQPTHAAIAEYIHLLKMLRRQQRGWVLDMLVQTQTQTHKNGGEGEGDVERDVERERRVKEVVRRVRGEMGGDL
jgi:hypothetical protein